MKPAEISHFTRTRLAPTPSGFLHLGNLASFVITAGIARRHGAKILLRIDDLDQERVRTEYVQDIFDTLHFLGIPWDEGPKDLREFQQSFSQVHRLPLYRQALQQLAEANVVFACTCSRSALAAAGIGAGYPGTCLSKKIPLSALGAQWRMLADQEKPLTYRDIFAGIQSRPLPDSMRYFQVRKKDGNPSYQLASVADDIYYGVDLVVRGEDLFESTLAQLFLAQHLPSNSFAESGFFHHALALDKSGRKLSKSAGDTSIKFLREKGKKPRDIFTAISAACHFPEPVDRWEALAERFLERPPI